jgi:hypothetical protein
MRKGRDILIAHLILLTAVVGAVRAASLVATREALEAMPLAGTWRFEMDRQDAGQAAAWFKQELPGSITLRREEIGE